MKEADPSDRMCLHNFYVCAVTYLLSQGVPLAEVQYLAGHADPITARLYDRRQQRVTRNIVEHNSV
jgi:integrase/recombinase XerD